jgi:Bacteriophage minor capsid protein
MSFLDDLGLYLQTQGLGTLGTDLFLGGLPVDVPSAVQQDDVTALVETPGFPAQYVHDVAGISWEQPVVQILVRGAAHDYVSARTQAQAVFVALGQIQNQALSGTYYFWVLPLQSPFKLRDDDFGRPILSVQFRCAKAL